MAQSGKRPPPPSANETGPRHVRPRPLPSVTGDEAPVPLAGHRLHRPALGFYEPVFPAGSAGAGRAPPENSAPACAQLFAEHSPSPQTKPPLPPLGSQGFSVRGQGVSPRPFRLPIASFRDAARLPRRILKYGTIASPLGRCTCPFSLLSGAIAALPQTDFKPKSHPILPKRGGPGLFTAGP